MKRTIAIITGLTMLAGCSATNPSLSTSVEEVPQTVLITTEIVTTAVTEETTTEKTTTEEVTAAGQESASDDAIRPEIKEAIDSYEAFVDEYSEFMKKYNSSDDSLSMLGDYLKYAEKSLEMAKEFEDIENEELTEAESLYYSEVLLRCSQKLLEAAY